MDNRYIGIFDSGIGGLTSVPYIMKLLPNERVIFFGDTARTPYGSKAPETIRQFAFQIGDFMVSKNVKMMVAACNTISAVALDALRKRYPDIPIIGTIGPTSNMIAKSCAPDEHIGILATKATVQSQSYLNKIRFHAPDLQYIYQKACPMFVPMIEEGIIDKEVMDSMIHYYLDDFIRENSLDTLVLACTHYPLLSAAMKRLYPGIRLISSSREVAVAVQMELEKRQILASPESDLHHVFYASDLSDNFIQMIQRILSRHESDLDIQFKNLEL